MGERGYKNHSCIKVLPIKHINWCYSFHLQKLVCLIPRDQKECYCERAPPPAKTIRISLQNWAVLSRFLRCHFSSEGMSLLHPLWRSPSLSYSGFWKATRLNKPRQIQSANKMLHPFVLSPVKMYVPGSTIPNICPTYFFQETLNTSHHPKPQTNPSKPCSAWPAWISSSCITCCLLQIIWPKLLHWSLNIFSLWYFW